MHRHAVSPALRKHVRRFTGVVGNIRPPPDGPLKRYEMEKYRRGDWPYYSRKPKPHRFCTDFQGAMFENPQKTGFYGSSPTSVQFHFLEGKARQSGKKLHRFFTVSAPVSTRS